MMKNCLIFILSFIVSTTCIGQLSVQLDSLLEQGKVLYTDKQFVEANEVFNQLVVLSKAQKEPVQLANYYYKLGRFYDSQRNYSKALIFLFDGITILSQKKQKKNSSELYFVINQSQESNWGIPYKTTIERDKGAQLLGEIYSRIGGVYYNQEEYEKAEIYWKKALSFAQANQLPKTISGALNNLGEIYRIKKDYHKALLLYQEAFVLKKLLNDSIGMDITLANIGNSYLQLEKLDSAKYYYDKGYEIAIATNIDFLKMGVYDNYGLYYHQIGQAKKAIKYYHEGLAIARENNDMVSVLNIVEQLAIIYEEQQKLDSALYFQKEVIALDKEITQEKKDKLALEIEAEYLINEKEKELAFLREKNLIEHQNQRLKVRLQLGFIIGLIILLSFLFFTLKLRNRHNKKLEFHLAQINQQNEEKDTLLKEIHHRVKNNLQVITSLLSLQSYNIEDQKTKELFSYSQYRINSMAMIHEMLYQSTDLSKIDYKTYLTQLLDSLVISMKGEHHQIKIDLDVPTIYLNIDTAIPLGLLVNEVVTNSLKYGIPNNNIGTLFVKMRALEAPKFVLEIGDDGVGFLDDQHSKNINSLGLKLIKKLSLQLNGKIKKDDSKKGTHYVLNFEEIPVNQPK